MGIWLRRQNRVKPIGRKIVGKGYGSGSYKLKKKTAEMLRIYLHRHSEKYPFPKSNIMGQVWRDTRKRTANKLCKPELNKIPLKNLRN